MAIPTKPITTRKKLIQVARKIMVDRILKAEKELALVQQKLMLLDLNIALANGRE